MKSRYFVKAQSVFFKWEDNGTVLSWDDGSTIAFAAELATAIRRLAPECVPPFNTIAMVTAACRDSWVTWRWKLQDLHNEKSANRFGDASSWEAINLRSALKQLDRIHAFPKHLRSNQHARAELLAMALQNRGSKWTAAEADRFATQIESGLEADALSRGGFEAMNRSHNNDTLIVQSIRQLVNDLLWLKNGLDAVTSEALESQLQTGLSDRITPTELDEPEEPLTPRDLMSQLLDDEELGGVARLAKNLLAVVHFPKSLAEQDDLPLGGVSDITNRGQLDQLLISELAHDDLTLAVRVAVNEAMYLRRESPPKARPQARHVLVDSGICMWGTPRVYAVAACLAMAATNDSDTTVQTWRGDGPNRHKIDLTSSTGLKEQLHALSSQLHCAEAIEGFVDSTNATDEQTEHVVVATDEAINSPEFQQTLRNVRSTRPLFVMSLSRDGRFELRLHNARGSKTIRKARINLEDVLSDKARKSISIDENHPLPVIFQLDEFPLRLPSSIVEGGLLDSERGTIAVTGDGRAVLWDKPDLGAIQLNDQLGRGKIQWVGSCTDGCLMFVHGKLKRDGLRIVRLLEDGSISVSPIRPTVGPKWVTGHRGHVITYNADLAECFLPGTIQPMIAQLDLPPGFVPEAAGVQNSASSRFLRNPRTPLWLALTAPGPKLEEIKANQRTTHIFDCHGHGPVTIEPYTRVYSSTSTREPSSRLYRPWTDGSIQIGSTFAISSDGHLLAYPDLSGQTKLLDIVSGETTDIGYIQPDHAVKRNPTPIREIQMRNKFSGIGVHNSQLVLRTNSGQFVALRTDADVVRLGNAKTSRQLGGQPETVDFTPIDGPRGTSYSLKRAKFENGSEAVLDSRFLLHLRGDGPQITIALREGLVSGWCEKSGFFGQAYFALDGQPQRNYNAAISALNTFVEPL
jgi:hypothetical protein